MAARHGIQSGIDGFVADADGVVHGSQYATGLLGGQACAQYAYHAFPDGVATHHFAGRTGFGLKTIGTLLSTITAIAA